MQAYRKASPITLVVVESACLLKSDIIYRPITNKKTGNEHPVLLFVNYFSLGSRHLEYQVLSIYGCRGLVTRLYMAL